VTARSVSSPSSSISAALAALRGWSHRRTGSAARVVTCPSSSTDSTLRSAARRERRSRHLRRLRTMTACVADRVSMLKPFAASRSRYAVRAARRSTGATCRAPVSSAASPSSRADSRRTPRRSPPHGVAACASPSSAPTQQALPPRRLAVGGCLCKACADAARQLVLPCARSRVEIRSLGGALGRAHRSPLDLRRSAAWDGTQDEGARLAWAKRSRRAVAHNVARIYCRPRARCTASLIPVTAGGAVANVGATAGILPALGVGKDVAIDFSLASGLLRSHDDTPPFCARNRLLLRLPGLPLLLQRLLSGLLLHVLLCVLVLGRHP